VCACTSPWVTTPDARGCVLDCHGGGTYAPDIEACLCDGAHVGAFCQFALEVPVLWEHYDVTHEDTNRRGFSDGGLAMLITIVCGDALGVAALLLVMFYWIPARKVPPLVTTMADNTTTTSSTTNKKKKKKNK
jgi:hypothetical protein